MVVAQIDNNGVNVAAVDTSWPCCYQTSGNGLCPSWSRSWVVCKAEKRCSDLFKKKKKKRKKRKRKGRRKEADGCDSVRRVKPGSQPAAAGLCRLQHPMGSSSQLPGGNWTRVSANGSCKGRRVCPWLWKRGCGASWCFLLHQCYRRGVRNGEGEWALSCRWY